MAEAPLSRSGVLLPLAHLSDSEATWTPVARNALSKGAAANSAVFGAMLDLTLLRLARGYVRGVHCGSR